MRKWQQALMGVLLLFSTVGMASLAATLISQISRGQAASRVVSTTLALLTFVVLTLLAFRSFKRREGLAPEWLAIVIGLSLAKVIFDSVAR